MSYDPKCLQLAVHFLWDEHAGNQQAAKELAQVIQDAIEQYLELIEHEPGR